MHARLSTLRARRGGAALTAFALAAALAGCGGDGGEVIARVGDRAITVADYEAAARGAMFRYPGPPDSAKALLIDDLVRERLLLEYGFRSDILVDSMVRRDRRHMEDQMLRSALINRLIPGSVPVSAAEVRRFWSWRDSAARCQLIYATARELADAAMSELVHGADFGSVADRFNLTGMLPPQGDLGYLLPGSLADPLDRMMRETPPGAIAGPVRAPGEGWFILKVTDRQPHQRDSLQAETPQIVEALRQRKRRALSARAFEAVRDQYRVALQPGAAEAFHAFYNQPGALGAADPAPTPEKLARVLATYDGGGGHRGAYTLGEAFDDLDAAEGERPNPYMLSSFAPWIESRVVDRVLMIEARRRGLDVEPEFARALRERFDGELVNSVFSMAIVQRTAPGEEDLRAAYERSRGPDDPPFEQLMADEARVTSLGFDALEIARMRRFQALADSLRAAYPVTIDDAAVKRLRWPITS